MVTSVERGVDDGQQNDRRYGDGQRLAGRRTDRTGQRLGGRLHAAVKPTVVELGDGAILSTSTLQTAVFRLVLFHRVGLDVPEKKLIRVYISKKKKKKDSLDPSAGHRRWIKKKISFKKKLKTEV